ncbi:MAG: non-hydrolyzing UDP-N-acetylglucosamine 2-epimerase, partial [Methyloligellaceae bacterium]
VVGDVNSTLACAITAKKLNIRVAHLEAGLRSGDRTMPEEINRIVTDSISDLLWAPSADAVANLKREGVADESIELVGNIMIDSLEMVRDRISSAASSVGLPEAFADRYGVVTFHRPANVDDQEALGRLVEALRGAAEVIPLIFPLHPRTRHRLECFGLKDRLTGSGRIHVLEPMGYVDFLGLVSRARVAITDSGGLQEETTHLEIPCLTLRDNTERPTTITEGTNRLVRLETLKTALAEALREPRETRRIPYWDGRTAERTVAGLARAAKRMAVAA